MLINVGRMFFGFFLDIVFSNDPLRISQVFIGKRCQFVWEKEHVGRKIILKMFESRETKYFTENIKKDDVCFDVGANVGYYANLFSSLVGCDGKVVAIEPVSRNVRLIQLASSLNKTEDILNIVCAGASDEDAKFYISTEGDSSYASVQSERVTAAEMIECRKLDTLCDELGIVKIDILKMDIEGWEYHALLGMEGILADSQRRPRLMMIELFSKYLNKYSSSIDEVCSYLSQFGYVSSVLDGKGDLIPFRKEHHDKIYNVFFR